jgi:hypothetical protein
MATHSLARGLRRLSHLDLPGGGQVTVAGRYAYVGHMKPPHGTSIIDIGDPTAPRVVATLMLDDERSHTHKVRVQGDLMVVNVEQNERHAMRRGARLAEAKAALSARLGRAPSDAELAAELKVQPEQLPRVRQVLREGYRDGGFKVYDISDRSRPRLLSYVRTHGFGVHRFDLDERYAYISTEMEGWLGNILMIYDLTDPTRPEEVARWWMPGQHIAAGETPTWPGYQNRLHHALRHGDQLWAAVWHAGLRVIDVSDIAAPCTVGAYDYHPPFPEPTHTVLRVPFPVQGRELAVAIDEEHDHVPGQLHAGLWVLDVGRLDAITPVGMWHLSELDSPFARAGGRFGAHQFQEHMSDTRLHIAWFAGGLRVVDIADPALPREVGHFIPEPVGGQTAPQTNDVDVDETGLVYLIDRNVGFDILEPLA